MSESVGVGQGGSEGVRERRGEGANRWMTERAS